LDVDEVVGEGDVGPEEQLQIFSTKTKKC